MSSAAEISERSVRMDAEQQAGQNSRDRERREHTDRDAAPHQDRPLPDDQR